MQKINDSFLLKLNEILCYEICEMMKFILSNEGGALNDT